MFLTRFIRRRFCNLTCSLIIFVVAAALEEARRRESRAVDTESLCVIAGKKVWSVRIDLHILDNGGNLVDAANIAALAAIMTFRRPDCNVGGENSQEVIIHTLEEREPVPLIIHHLPIAFTFGFFNKGNVVVTTKIIREHFKAEQSQVAVSFSLLNATFPKSGL